jgi:hypothetical protein
MIDGGCVSVDTNRRLLFATKIVAAEVVFVVVAFVIFLSFSSHDRVGFFLERILLVLVRRNNVLVLLSRRPVVLRNNASLESDCVLENNNKNSFLYS